jgi:TetR/AcrR family transcriptional regulator, transcriptional repressor of bet genes
MTSIDHDERRRRIAEVAFDLIAREGLDAATIRRIAAQVGYSTTVITHYFADKQELLIWAYRTLVEQAHERFTSAAQRDPPDLIASLVAMIASDDASIRAWRVYIAFWERAARDPIFREQQRSNMSWSLEGIGTLIQALYPACSDVDRISRILSAVVQGISIQMLVDRESWSLSQIHAALTREVNSLLGRR